jgi:hypothetical protein
MTKNAGTSKTASQLAASMPENTVMPIERRALAPAPDANAAAQPRGRRRTMSSGLAETPARLGKRIAMQHGKARPTRGSCIRYLHPFSTPSPVRKKIRSFSVI